MPSPIIQVTDLVKRYGDVTAVDGISFDVQEGEVFGLLGPNGAGKTTTLEIIEAIKKPTSGSVTLDGIDVLRQADQVRRRIGIQLQSSGYYPRLTLTELLSMFGLMYGVPVKPMEVLERFSLTEKAKSYFDDLSGGQKQRFSLATTLINSPRIIFLDEPTTGLDPQARINLWDVVQEINAQGTTIIITTHYMDEAEHLCDSLAIVDRGKIVNQGSPQQLIDDLLATGFQRKQEVRLATLEDVFLNLTGRTLREA
jgi:ABC-2 type transport system ATP-binding protein